MKKIFDKIKEWVNGLLGGNYLDSLYGGHDPFVLQFHNTTDEMAKCILFGGNLFLLKENHGSDAGVNILNLQGSDYTHLLTHLMSKKIVFRGMRIESSTPGNLQQTLKLIDSQPHGTTRMVPIQINKYKEEGQFAEDIIDISRKFTFTGDTYFEFAMLPNSVNTISLFPNHYEEVVNPIPRKPSKLIKILKSIAPKLTN